MYDLRAFVEKHGLDCIAQKKILLHERILAELDRLERPRTQNSTSRQQGIPSKAGSVSARQSGRKKSTERKSDSLRKDNILAQVDSVWSLRGEKDVYTSTKRRIYETKRVTTQVDHVLEIQLLNFAWEEGVANNPQLPVKLTRALRSNKARELSEDRANNVDNLNVTLRYINQQKKGPFTRFLNAHRKVVDNGATQRLALDEHISGWRKANKHQPKLVTGNEWGNIKRTVVRAFDDMVDKKEEDMMRFDVAGKQREAYLSFLDVLECMICCMDIE